MHSIGYIHEIAVLIVDGGIFGVYDELETAQIDLVVAHGQSDIRL